MIATPRTATFVRTVVVALVKLLVWLLASAAAPTLLWCALEHARADPFATSNDNWSYFLPLITRQTDAWLRGAPLRIAWELGAGFNPYESAQTGVLWPGYVVAGALRTVLARAFGGFTLLDVSALVSMVTAAWLAVALLPRRWSRGLRWAVSAVVSTSPASIALGESWHNYLSALPATVALLALVVSAFEQDTNTPRHNMTMSAVLLVLFSSLLFVATHVQMYVYGIFLLLLWIAVWPAARAARISVAVRVMLAQLPMVAPLIALKLHSLQLSSDFAGGRLPYGAIPSGSLGPLQFIVGALFGTRLHALAVDAQAAVFAPLLFAVLVLALKQRRYGLLALTVLWLSLLTPRSLPLAQFIMLGPLADLRWPHKVMIFIAPMALLVVVHTLRNQARWQRFATPVVMALAAAQAWVVTDVGVRPTLKSAHAVGARGLVERGRACQQQWQLTSADRIAPVADITHSTIETLPLALLAWMNNAPSLFGVSTLYLYEPMESTKSFEDHMKLGRLWKSALKPKDLTASKTLDELRAHHVTALLAARAEDLAGVGPLEPCSVMGETIFLTRLAPTAPSFPAVRGTVLQAVVATPDGHLVAHSEGIPELNVSRAVVFAREGGAWVGTPRLWPRALAPAFWLSIATMLVGLRACSRKDVRPVTQT